MPDSKPQTLVIVASEESGDNIGAMLAEQLKAQRPGVRLIGLGGPRMAAAGVELLHDMIEHSATGLVEVAKSVSFFIGAIKDVAAAAKSENAIGAVLIDSPDLNLRIAPKIKRLGIPVIYYVSPQVWAWRSRRVTQIKRDTDELMVILPFEVDWYKQRGMDVTFVGHPLLDRLDFDAIRAQGDALREELAHDQPLIGLLPGSRGNEIKRLLPRFLEASRLIHAELPEARFAIGCSHWLTPERVGEFLQEYRDLPITPVFDRTHAVMAGSDYLLCCSGTATLESALIGTPLLMAYVVNKMTEMVARQIFKQGDLFCLANIILGGPVISEQLQENAEPEMLAEVALREMRERGEELRSEFARLRELLGGGGASERAAQRVLEVVEKSEEPS